MHSPESSGTISSTEFADQHVVILINYMRRHHVLAFKEFAKHVGKLTILVSTPMEGDRQWEPQWDGLNVIVQRNSTVTLNRSSGFKEKNYIHVPWDTVFQLRKLNPDIVLSYEMGMRTLFCSGFRLLNRNVPLVMVGNMSDSLETRRGFVRQVLRKVIKSSVDYCTYNGPSCKRYLQNIGLPAEKLLYVPYCFDVDKTHQGEKTFSPAGVQKLLYCGTLNERKGVLPFTKLLGEYCKEFMDREISLTIAGDGPYFKQIQALNYRNLEIDLIGSRETDQLAGLYAEADACVFPTLGDEWGLVPIEAWASGLPVLGSQYAQSVESNCQNGQNGWVYDVDDRNDTFRALREMLETSPEQLQAMSINSRNSIDAFRPTVSANQFCEVLRSAFGREQSVAGESDQSAVAATAKSRHSEPNSDQVATGFVRGKGIDDNSSRALRSMEQRNLPMATMSLDLDNKWAYLKSHNDSSWESLPSYLPEVVPRILDTLDDLNLRITFCVVGQDAVIEQNVEALSMIADRGHEIANHSFHHDPHLHLYTPEQLEHEIELSEQAIERVTGRKPVGFRGPGFSLSNKTLEILVRRNYLYDCTTLPTYFAPVARAYYFMTGKFDKKQREERNAMFGRFSDGFLSNDPYLWQSDHGKILELPVTTFPAIKTPAHATYLHYMANFSSFAANCYFKSALSCYRMSGTAPSFLLHPLDFMGIEDAPELAFFPAMNAGRDLKLARTREFLKTFTRHYNVVPMCEFASLALNKQLNHRSVAVARTGIS